jgi:hypothetical protein
MTMLIYAVCKDLTIITPRYVGNGWVDGFEECDCFMITMIAKSVQVLDPVIQL